MPFTKDLNKYFACASCSIVAYQCPLAQEQVHTDKTASLHWLLLLSAAPDGQVCFGLAEDQDCFPGVHQLLMVYLQKTPLQMWDLYSRLWSWDFHQGMPEEERQYTE